MRNSGVMATALLLAACGGHSSGSGNNGFILTINVVGQGTVTAAAQSIACASICAQQIAAGTGVHLDASPAAGMQFMGWSGACSGMDGCIVELSQDTQVGANFAASVSVSVVLVGAGSGRVVSSPSGIDCPGTCAMMVAPGTPVTLSSEANAGSNFEGYGVGCQGLSCGFTAIAPTTIYANFSALVVPVDACVGVLPRLPQSQTLQVTPPSGVDRHCRGATSDGLGNEGESNAMRTVFSSTGASVAHASNEVSALGPFPLHSGFVLFLLDVPLNDVAYAPDGTVASSIRTTGPDFGVAANGGSLLVACHQAGSARTFEVHRFDDTNAEISMTSWTDDNAGACPTIGTYGSVPLIDAEDRILLLYAPPPFDSPDPIPGRYHLAARWVDVKSGPMTDWFDAGEFPAAASILARPLIGGGAAVRVGDDWVASIPSGKAEVHPAPAFFEAKKDAHIVLGGKAYAMIPDKGIAATLDLVAPGGQSCGALMTTTTEDCVSLGKDGTLIESTGADACMLTYYPQALK